MDIVFFCSSTVFAICSRVLLGRSHIKAVAENRRAEIERFLQELMSASAEIAHVCP